MKMINLIIIVLFAISLLSIAGCIVSLGRPPVEETIPEAPVQ